MRAQATSLKRVLGVERAVAQSGVLPSHDARWACHNLIEVVSAAADEDFLAVGSTPWPGDYAGTALTVPSAPTTNQFDRYLFRLAAVEIPSGASIVVRGLRMAVELVAPYTTDAGTFPLYLEQESPFWHFSDGNVSWHLRHQQNLFRNVFDPAQAPGTSPTLRGTQPARLYQLGGPAASPGSGIPPGVDVEGLGTMRDLRYPWKNTDWTLEVPVGGPGIVALYCSVKQTNPETRPQTPVVAGDSLRREDRFVLQTRQAGVEVARYGRVAGALLVEMFPCCKAPGEH